MQYPVGILISFLAWTDMLTLLMITRNSLSWTLAAATGKRSLTMKIAIERNLHLDTDYSDSLKRHLVYRPHKDVSMRDGYHFNIS